MGRSKTSDHAKLERQRALARERQRRRRQALTEEQIKQKREKDLERYHRLKRENKIKTVADKTPRELRKLRKYWRESSKKYRAKKKAELNAINNTPPVSCDESLNEETQSSQKVRGRKKVRKDRAKVYRTVNKQNIYIKKLERKVEKYKKRLQREKKKMALQSSPSPRKQVKSLIGNEKISPKVKKQLFLGFALEKQVKSQLKEAGKRSKKQQLLCKAIGNKVLKKYRVQKYFTDLIPYTMKTTLNTETFNYVRQKRRCVRFNIQRH